jgi:serine/threonine protein phosphatase PrpC
MLEIVEKASRSDVGRQRQSNEDAYLERSPLFAVADGMGGARAGEVAARMAVEAFDRTPPSGSAEEQLAAVARTANDEIYRLAQEDSSRAGMGTTLTAAVVRDGEISIGHVGDSRLYRFRDSELERLTDDHSLVEELVKQNKLTPEEAEVHPQRSIITRALGPEPDVQVDTHTHAARAGDIYLICSDGLTGMVSEAGVAAILRNTRSLQEAADRLVTAANEAGGKDNITVVLFRLGEHSEVEEASDTLGDQETNAGGLTAMEVREALAETRGGTATVAPERPRVARQAPARQRRSPRPQVASAVVLIVVAALLVGLYAGTRQFWFVGTNDRGQVTLFRGVPYDLPFGIPLYTKQYQSSVPASAISDPRQRSHDINHQLRTRGDAVGLIRHIESGQTRP